MQRFTEQNAKQTPQSMPIPGRPEMVQNNAGGYTFAVDDWTRLERFLIIGTEGGTYYVDERTLTKREVPALERCIKADGPRTVRVITEISDAGRAPKNDPALFALALCVARGDENTKRDAYQALAKVARIGTHLFHFMQYVKDLGGPCGHGFQRAVQRWYLERKPTDLAYQAVKYQSRDGWSHRDVLRLVRPKAKDGDQQALFHWIVKGRQKDTLPSILTVPESGKLVWCYERLKELAGYGADLQENITAAAYLISEYKVPHEAVPNEFKQYTRIWEALLEGMKPEAMLRNLNKMTAVGLLVSNMSDATKKVLATFGDAEVIRRARLHPLKILLGMKTYAQGHGEKGKLTWQPVSRIVDALDGAFYLAFKAVEPTGKRILLALDVSGSMGGAYCGSGDILTCREGAAAMALVTANVEPQYDFVGFTAGNSPSMHYGYGTAITRLSISPRQRLDDVCRYTAGLSFGGTDCSLPMLWATQQRLQYDCIQILTDNETWAGNIQPSQALKQYRQALGVDTKLVVVAMAAGEFTIADPQDSGMMDVVGFDASTPAVIADFVQH